MLGLLPRVSRAPVRVDGRLCGTIAAGLLVLAAVERGDTEAQARRLAERIANYRVFSDSEGRMNLSLAQPEGELLLLSQFTLAARSPAGTGKALKRTTSWDLAESAAGSYSSCCCSHW